MAIKIPKHGQLAQWTSRGQGGELFSEYYGKLYSQFKISMCHNYKSFIHDSLLIPAICKAIRFLGRGKATSVDLFPDDAFSREELTQLVIA